MCACVYSTSILRIVNRTIGLVLTMSTDFWRNGAAVRRNKTCHDFDFSSLIRATYCNDGATPDSTEPLGVPLIFQLTIVVTSTTRIYLCISITYSMLTNNPVTKVTSKHSINEDNDSVCVMGRMTLEGVLAGMKLCSTFGKLGSWIHLRTGVDMRSKDPFALTWRTFVSWRTCCIRHLGSIFRYNCYVSYQLHCKWIGLLNEKQTPLTCLTCIYT